MADELVPGPLGQTPLSVLVPFPFAPSFSGLVARELAPLTSIDPTLVAAADQVAHAGDSDVQGDTSGDVLTLAQLLGVVPDTLDDGELAAIDRAAESFDGELGARADELPPESAPPPEVDLPPPVPTPAPDEGPTPAPSGPGPAPPSGDPREPGFRTLVRGWYLSVLAREPDADGWTVWVRRLLAGEPEFVVFNAFRAAAQTELDTRGG